MEYLFVFANGGWWIKIDSIEKLIDYHKKTGNRYAGAYDLFMRFYEKTHDANKIMEGVMELPFEERIALMDSRDFKYMYGAIMQAQKIGEANIFDGFRGLNMEIGMNQMRNIKEYGAVFINAVGGSTFALKYTQFFRRKELIFPDFKKEDIRVKQFKGGEHWYVYVGDMQVRNGDALKWNTYDEAYKKALDMVE